MPELSEAPISVHGTPTSRHLPTRLHITSQEKKTVPSSHVLLQLQCAYCFDSKPRPNVVAWNLFSVSQMLRTLLGPFTNHIQRANLGSGMAGHTWKPSLGRLSPKEASPGEGRDHTSEGSRRSSPATPLSFREREASLSVSRS